MRSGVTRHRMVQLHFLVNPSLPTRPRPVNRKSDSRRRNRAKREAALTAQSTRFSAAPAASAAVLARIAAFSLAQDWPLDRKSTRLNSSHLVISYAVFCLKKKKYNIRAAQYKQT